MGREAMNAAPRSEGRGRRSSKDPMATKLDPLKELNGGSFPPSIAASGASKAGRFRVCDSSSKESLAAGSKTATGTPRSAPPNSRNVTFNSKITAKAVPRKIGSTTDLRRKKDPFPKIDLEPKRTILLSFGAREAVDEAKLTPPVQASISPEVPMESSLVTSACFAAGHVIVGVHDRRKCRPRGILSVGGGRELEIPEFNGGVVDPTRVSVTPPPPAGASINWLSSPSKNENLAHLPAEASIDWIISPDHGKSLGLNSPCLETTPSSSGVMLQRTPTAPGDNVSPFSSILERIAKTSESQHREPGHSLVDDHGTSAPSLYSSSTKNNNLCEPRPPSHNANLQTTFSGTSFQFGSVEASSSDNIDQTRISWREGLVSRIFAMNDSEGYRWLSDDEDDLNCLEEDRANLISEGNDQNGHIAAAGFGSVEFVFEAEKTGAKGPMRGPISSAESISMEEIVLAASDDSDWAFSYKNHLFH